MCCPPLLTTSCPAMESSRRRSSRTELAPETSFQINLCVELSRVQRDLPQPRTDRVQIDASQILVRTNCGSTRLQICLGRRLPVLAYFSFPSHFPGARRNAWSVVQVLNNTFRKEATLLDAVHIGLRFSRNAMTAVNGWFARVVGGQY